MTGDQEHFAWMEIGRASPDGGAPWTAWMAPLPEGGVLYRTLIVADGALTVTVDVQQCRGAGMRTLHKGRRDLLQSADDGSVRRLLGTTDEATRAALARSDQGCSTRPAPVVLPAAAAGRQQSAPLPSGL
jgi:hypothetical protein